jgi:hypothetical protein
MRAWSPAPTRPSGTRDHHARGGASFPRRSTTPSGRSPAARTRMCGCAAAGMALARPRKITPPRYRSALFAAGTRGSDRTGASGDVGPAGHDLGDGMPRMGRPDCANAEQAMPSLNAEHIAEGRGALHPPPPMRTIGRQTASTAPPGPGAQRRCPPASGGPGGPHGPAGPGWAGGPRAGGHPPPTPQLPVAPRTGYTARMFANRHQRKDGP